MRRSYDEANRVVGEWDAKNEAGTKVTYTYDVLPGCAACTELAGQLGPVSFPVDAGVQPASRGVEVYDATGQVVWRNGMEFAWNHRDGWSRRRTGRSGRCATGTALGWERVVKEIEEEGARRPGNRTPRSTATRSAGVRNIKLRLMAAAQRRSQRQ